MPEATDSGYPAKLSGSADQSSVRTRLKHPLTRPHAVVGVRSDQESSWRQIKRLRELGSAWGRSVNTCAVEAVTHLDIGA